MLTATSILILFPSRSLFGRLSFFLSSLLSSLSCFFVSLIFSSFFLFLTYWNYQRCFSISSIDLKEVMGRSKESYARTLLSLLLLFSLSSFSSTIATVGNITDLRRSQENYLYRIINICISNSSTYFSAVLSYGTVIDNIDFFLKSVAWRL